ncbi:GGDEF domain-containing protein [Litorimonas cladophorae]|uniref:GGDEF domain-containing protein n=1 Tax=Litorimonas cladophorae TaxID=1220491 RepID=A0A918KED9_9PROT|nr:diguanylate cyclase [Litorimonas cladophorae]GGX58884.1 GGDEF domain-containing protein [Litorimonas cladophorae]
MLIVSDHPTESRAVASNLRRLDLDVQLALFDGKTLSAIPTQAPDAVLCHLTDYAERGPQLAKVVRSHFSPVPMPVIGAMSRPSENSSVEFDTTLFSPMHPSQIANRVNGMIRLGAMESEIGRRLATLSETFNFHPDLGDMTPNRRFRVLFIGKASPAFMVIINALQDKGVDVVAAFTSFSAFDYLHGEPFDAVVMNALEQTEPAFSISEAMRRNSRLFHTPTLFLTDKKTFESHDAAYAKGAHDIIEVDADPQEISGRILELANYHRVHEQLKTDFSALTTGIARDSSDTAFSREFMEAHVPRLLADAKTAGVPLTLMALRLVSNSDSPVETRDVADVAQKVAALLGNLVRMQDVVSRWNAETFILAFYNTNRTEAEVILNRIEALFESSIFEEDLSCEEKSAFKLEICINQIDSETVPARDILNDIAAKIGQ